MNNSQAEKKILREAILFASSAHGEIDQRRKYTNEPYIIHPIRVMCLVQASTGDQEVHAAAILHDVLEDTARQKSDISVRFGDRVATIVEELTSPPKAGKSRDDRKLIDRIRLASASPEAQTIKLADIIDNIRDMHHARAADPEFARMYLLEKSLMVQVLSRGCPRLRKRAELVLMKQSV